MFLRHSWLLIAVLLMFPPLGQAIDDSSLVLYAPFEEGSGDTTQDLASGLVGTINGAQWTSEGKIGNALEFSGANHFVEFPKDGVLDITDAITMEAWIFPEQVQADSDVMGRRTSANVGGYCMQWTNGKVETWIHIGGWKGTRNRQSIEPEPGEWHHIVGIYTGDKIIQYVDGQLDIEFDQSGAIGSVQEVFRIGQAQTGLTSLLGKIDEVAVYNRALTEEEVLADMEQGVIPAAVSPEGKLATLWANLRRVP